MSNIILGFLIGFPIGGLLSWAWMDYWWAKYIELRDKRDKDVV